MGTPALTTGASSLRHIHHAVGPARLAGSVLSFDESESRARADLAAADALVAVQRRRGRWRCRRCSGGSSAWRPSRAPGGVSVVFPSGGRWPGGELPWLVPFLLRARWTGARDRGTLGRCPGRRSSWSWLAPGRPT